MRTHIPLLWAAGAVQLIMVGANVVLPKKLHYQENLSKMSPLLRQIFVVHSMYIVLVVTGFSGLCFFFSARLLDGDPLGRSLSAFLAVFWLFRIALQLAYYDSDYRREHRLADVAYTGACCFLGGVFAVAAIGI